MNTSLNQWFKTVVVAIALTTLSTVAGTAGDFSIQFSLTGTADSSQYGYISGQSYTFNWIVNSGFMNNASSQFTANNNFWTDEFVSQAPIFSDLSGDGLTGSWQRPVLNEVDPYSYINVWYNHGTHTLILLAANDSDYSIGLQANGTNVWGMDAFIQIGNIFNFPASYTDPNDYFASFTGTYTPNNSTMWLYPVIGSSLTFTPTSLSISTIPEPSTALLTGLGLVALFFRRRRH